MKNKCMTAGFSLSAIFMLLVMITLVRADDVPPQGGKPLSAILKSVEALQLGTVTTAEFDDGVWEIKVCKGKEGCVELYIDPVSGEEKRRKTDDLEEEVPPANARPLSSVIQSLEKRGLRVITEVEFDDNVWEVKVREGRRQVKLYIDPVTGEEKR
ncbi:MAG: hypothetical protein A4E57_03613 [Syntrophorhabdaceae bacterium PtaU1.Bin034]|jgi:hypothetical protein|nr:MAG: hypothetical protein A4E57_03613 [Syntrophorhabdaceae bacterium PtaU1.Bin034]